MKYTTMVILNSCMLLFACQQYGQQAHKEDSMPIDSALILTNNSCQDTVLPDSARITIISPRFGMDSIVFSIKYNEESSIEMSYILGKKTLSRSYSIQILGKIGSIFIEHKLPVIIAKKLLSDKVSSDLPFIKFVIYYDGKTISNEYFVGKRQNHYEITYSDSFLELYNLLYAEAIELYESKQ